MGESANERRPKLVAVGDEAAEATPGASGASRGAGSWLPLLAGILAVALGITSVGWFRSAQHAGQLESRVATVESELGVTRTALGRAEGRLSAFQGHVASARDRVAALASQIGALDAFLAADPAADDEPARP